MRKVRMPHLEARLEDGQGNRRQEAGGASLTEVQRDGSVLLPAAAASRVRQLQELRRIVPRCFHGWQWSCHAWQSHFLRAQGGCRRRWQEEVSRSLRDDCPAI